MPCKNPMPYGGPNTENGPLNDSVGQMPNQSTHVQSATVPPTSLVVNNQAKLSDVDEIISTLNSETTSLENSLKDCVLQHKSLQNDHQVFKSDKQNLSEQLTAEKERSEELHLQQVDSQQADLSLKKTTIDDQNKYIEELKQQKEEESRYERERREKEHSFRKQIQQLEARVSCLDTLNKVQISDLTQKVDEICWTADGRIGEMKKSELLEEFKKMKNFLQDKEKQLSDINLFAKEHNCKHTIQNLMEAKATLSIENCHLNADASTLKKNLKLLHDLLVQSKDSLEFVERHNEDFFHKFKPLDKVNKIIRCEIEENLSSEEIQIDKCCDLLGETIQLLVEYSGLKTLKLRYLNCNLFGIDPQAVHPEDKIHVEQPCSKDDENIDKTIEQQPCSKDDENIDKTIGEFKRKILEAEASTLEKHLKLLDDLDIQSKDCLEFIERHNKKNFLKFNSSEDVNKISRCKIEENLTSEEIQIDECCDLLGQTIQLLVGYSALKSLKLTYCLLSMRLEGTVKSKS